MKVLIMCSSFSVYVVYYIEEMRKRYPEIQFSVFTHIANVDRYDELLGGNLSRIYNYNRLWELPKAVSSFPQFDVIHTFWMEIQWGFMSKALRSKCKKIVVSVGGSDLYRSKAWEHIFQRQLISQAEWVSAENPETLEDFFGLYGERYRIKKNKVVRFGLTNLKEIDKYLYDEDGIRNTKKKYQIPQDKIVITCGHNARKQHQHIEMIKSIGKMEQGYKQQIHLLIPMTYPDGMQEYIEIVKECVASEGLTCSVLTDFMDTEEMAQYEVCTDIMIHVQTTDQMSSTMLEQMYAGKIIVAGSWLPYQSIRDAGVHFYSVDDVEKITELLTNLISAINEEKAKCRCNHQRIHDFSSWDSVGPEWIEMYQK